MATELGDDDVLVDRARRGEMPAFDALYHRYAPRVYALAMRMTADSSRAADVTQDVFVSVWERLHTFRGDSPFVHWLMRVTSNACINEARAAIRLRSHVEFVEDLDATGTPGRASQPPMDDRMDLEAAIARLPRGAREVLVLHDIHGYKHEEIAEMTGTAAGTVRAQVWRARKLLREALA